MTPAIIAVFEADACRQMEQTIVVLRPETDEAAGPGEAFDQRVEAEATRMATRFGAVAFIYKAVAKATIPVNIEDIA